MSNTIQIKRSSTANSVPTAAQLAQGELAVNLTDRKLYTKNASNAVVELTTPAFNINGLTTTTVASDDFLPFADTSDSGNPKKATVQSVVALGLNATGNAPTYACRAWVNFDGTTSPGSIRGSGNVSSVTKNGAGDYTLTFSTAMPDVNYSIAGTTRGSTNHPVRAISLHTSATPQTGSVRIACGTTGASTVVGRIEDSDHIFISIFR
jgi:hypothetical protein